MTATYSQELPDKPGPFHLHATANVTAYGAEFDSWESREGEQHHREEPEALRITLEAPAALDTPESAEIKKEVCAGQPIEFAYASEQEFARMLDARDISWQYKPRTFAVEWDDDGNFVDCFTPDFYLSANETYIALIVRDCSEANLKVRSVKLLRRQYPEIRIEILMPD